MMREWMMRTMMMMIAITRRSISIIWWLSGQSLFEHDTASSAHPHAPAVAKPFHVVDDFECGDGHDCGAETVFEPESLSMRCVFQ